MRNFSKWKLYLSLLFVILIPLASIFLTPSEKQHDQSAPIQSQTLRHDTAVTQPTTVENNHPNKTDQSHHQSVPNDVLAMHEAAGGHLIARHVGKTEAELLERVATGNVKTASSFTDRATAETITRKALNANKSQINHYLADNKRGYLEINYKSASPIGISISRGQSHAVKVSNTKIIIAKDPSMPAGYRIITGYPTP